MLRGVVVVAATLLVLVAVAHASRPRRKLVGADLLVAAREGMGVEQENCPTFTDMNSCMVNDCFWCGPKDASKEFHKCVNETRSKELQKETPNVECFGKKGGSDGGDKPKPPTPAPTVPPSPEGPPPGSPAPASTPVADACTKNEAKSTCQADHDNCHWCIPPVTDKSDKPVCVDHKNMLELFKVKKYTCDNGLNVDDMCNHINTEELCQRGQKYRDGEEECVWCVRRKDDDRVGSQCLRRMHRQLVIDLGWTCGDSGMSGGATFALVLVVVIAVCGIGLFASWKLQVPATFWKRMSGYDRAAVSDPRSFMENEASYQVGGDF